MQANLNASVGMSFVLLVYIV